MYWGDLFFRDYASFREGKSLLHGACMHPSVETVRKCLGDSLLKSPTTILWARHSHATPYKDWRKNNQFIQFDVLLSQCLTMDW